MCGIVGACGDLASKVPIEKMVSLLEHRGPDDVGFLVSPEESIVFGHRRLAIVDLESRSRQPMRSKCRRYTIVFNGEIYNFKWIRRVLERLGVEFITSGDTEVLLEGFAKWKFGVLEHLNGMFAAAIWDHKDRSLYLLRDRCGVKPLYYALSRFEKGLVFASEMRALALCKALRLDLSDKHIGEFLWLGYVRSPNTIIEQIRKLRPAHYAIWNSDSGWREVRYWRPPNTGSSKHRNSEEAAEELQPLLEDAFQLRLEADVPVGLLLSGGVDSAIVLGLLHKVTSKSLKTFTLGFESSKKDERHRAKQYAEFNNSEHHEYQLGPEEYGQWRRKISSIFDEPLGDVSAIPTCVIARQASKRVKVLLSADGADEWFGGYRRHQWASILSTVAMCAPQPVWRGFYKASSLDAIQKFTTAVGNISGIRAAPDKSARVLSFLAEWPDLKSYLELNAIAPSAQIPDELLPSGPYEALSLDGDRRMREGFLQRALAFDRSFYLSDNILLKLDRATMSSSVEGRDPFLDHRVLELAAALPHAVLFDKRNNKPVLRAIAERIYGKGSMSQKKLGFGAPLLEWNHEFSIAPTKIVDEELRSVLGHRFQEEIHRHNLPVPLMECIELLDNWCQEWRKWRQGV